MDRTIEVKRKPTHYEIYVNDEFYSSCDFNELKEELEEIEKSVDNSIQKWYNVKYEGDGINNENNI